ncbi:MAG: hypothetical protein AAB014_01780 [Nitrospirota bacterium]
MGGVRIDGRTIIVGVVILIVRRVWIVVLHQALFIVGATGKRYCK